MNIALIDTKSHEVKVYSGKKLLCSPQFDRALFANEVEELRHDPELFLSKVGFANSNHPTHPTHPTEKEAG